MQSLKYSADVVGVIVQDSGDVVPHPPTPPLSPLPPTPPWPVCLHFLLDHEVTYQINWQIVPPSVFVEARFQIYMASFTRLSETETEGDTSRHQYGLQHQEEKKKVQGRLITASHIVPNNISRKSELKLTRVYELPSLP